MNKKAFKTVEMTLNPILFNIYTICIGNYTICLRIDTYWI